VSATTSASGSISKISRATLAENMTTFGYLDWRYFAPGTVDATLDVKKASGTLISGPTYLNGGQRASGDGGGPGSANLTWTAGDGVLVVGGGAPSANNTGGGYSGFNIALGSGAGAIDRKQVILPTAGQAYTVVCAVGTYVNGGSQTGNLSLTAHISDGSFADDVVTAIPQTTGQEQITEYVYTVTAGSNNAVLNLDLNGGVAQTAYAYWERVAVK
jgi:hypothetical protein